MDAGGHRKKAEKSEQVEPKLPCRMWVEIHHAKCRLIGQVRVVEMLCMTVLEKLFLKSVILSEGEATSVRLRMEQTEPQSKDLLCFKTTILSGLSFRGEKSVCRL